MANTSKAAGGFSLPLIYRAVFLLIEPLFALSGAYLAHVDQAEFLRLTHAASAPSSIPLGTSVVMSQLANMCFLFSLMQALVLRSTSDLRVWKTFIFCLLVGDIGHLYSLKELGVHKYWDLMSWTISDLGIPVSYFGMALRIAFLAGIGMGGSKTIKAKKTA